MNRVLIFGDDPTGTTGFGRLVDALVCSINNMKNTKTLVVGMKINRGEYTKCDLINASKKDRKDINGWKTLEESIKEFKPDLVITVGDPWDYIPVSEYKSRYEFMWCGIVPVECPPYPRYIMVDKSPPKYLDVKKIQKNMDYIVTYSEFAIDEIKKMFQIGKDKMNPPPMENIYLFVNNNIFKKQKVRKTEVFNLIKDDDLLFTYIKINSQRAGFDSMIESWAKYMNICKEKNPALYSKSKLYIRTFPNGPGYNIPLLITRYGLETSILINPMLIDENDTSDEHISRIYNCSDFYISSARAEGFGLPPLEAMSCGVPCIVPDYGCPAEYGKGAVETVKIASTFNPDFSLTDFAIIDIDDMANKMFNLVNDKEKQEKMIEAGYQITKNLSKNKFIKEWQRTITSLLKQSSSKTKTIFKGEYV